MPSGDTRDSIVSGGLRLREEERSFPQKSREVQVEQIVAPLETGFEVDTLSYHP